MYTSVILPHFIGQLQGYAKKYRHLTDAVAAVLDDFHKERHARLFEIILFELGNK